MNIVISTLILGLISFILFKNLKFLNQDSSQPTAKVYKSTNENASKIKRETLARFYTAAGYYPLTNLVINHFILSKKSLSSASLSDLSNKIFWKIMEIYSAKMSERGLSDRDVQKLSQFYESPDGKKFAQVLNIKNTFYYEAILLNIGEKTTDPAYHKEVKKILDLISFKNVQNTLITVTYFIDKKELSEATADEARRRIENVVSDELKIRGVGSAQLSKITQTIESREHKIILDVISDPDLMPKIIREFLK